MYDLRTIKTIDLANSQCLKENTTYKFKDSTTGKDLIAKFISYYEDSDDNYLITEFKKLALLSGEPEIATVYYLANGKISNDSKSCYVMEFIEGKSLQSFLDSRDSIIYEVAIDIIMQLALGLEKAHNYEIYHSDLHNENIIINKYGYVKLIDFLWWDVNLSKEINLNKDLEDFKKIVTQFLDKCSSKDKMRFKYISDYCLEVSSFKGLKKELQLIDEMSFDLALLDDKSIKLLYNLFEITKDDYTLNSILRVTESEIPKAFIPDLTESEKSYLEKNRSGKLKLIYSDSRIQSIDRNLNHQLDLKFHSLKQTNLIEWKHWITNKGEKFVGPYKLNYDVIFTSKFLRWKRTNELMELIQTEIVDIEKIIVN
jgi:hypothetical protein